MRFRYYCFKCGNYETVKYALGEITCHICGQVMVFQGTEIDD